MCYIVDSIIHQLSKKSLITFSYAGSCNTSSIDCDLARRALVQCTDIIVESSIDSSVLARKLYSEMIISETFYRRIRDRTCGSTNEERLENILDEITDLIKHDAGILTKFVNILREKLNRNDLADKVMSKLKYESMSFLFLKLTLFTFRLS